MRERGDICIYYLYISERIKLASIAVNKLAFQTDNLVTGAQRDTERPNVPQRVPGHLPPHRETDNTWTKPKKKADSNFNPV